jgi:hypothetical protein
MRYSVKLFYLFYCSYSLAGVENAVTERSLPILDAPASRFFQTRRKFVPTQMRSYTKIFK